MNQEEFKFHTESREEKGGRVSICDLEPGSEIRAVFLLVAKEARLTRLSKPYLRLRLADRTGQIDCTVWEPANSDSDMRSGEVVLVTGVVTEYQGKLQIEASEVRSADPDQVNPRDFLPVTYRDLEELKDFLFFHIHSVKDKDFRTLLDHIFQDEEFLNLFTHTPAAKSFHHAYLGGLVEHTVAVADLCEFVAQQYPRVNRDLLLAAALLHDIGKTQELSFQTVIDYTDSGRLLGHVVQGVILVREKASVTGFSSQEKLNLLLHCIVSHHGELEWGSPKRPKTLEALILHHVDNLDAKVKGFLEIVEGTRDASWTDMRNLFRRPLHVPRAAHQEVDFLPPQEEDPLVDNF